LIHRAQNVFEHTIGITEHVVIPIAQNEIAHSLQNIRSIRVHCSALIMLPAIELHDELRLCAAKVDNKSLDRYLPLELPAGKSSIAQTKPEHTLGIGLILPQLPRESCISLLHRPPHPNPLPDGERESAESVAPLS
jgi:hypothetical protein